MRCHHVTCEKISQELIIVNPSQVNDCFLPVSVFFDRIFRAEQLVDALPKAAQALVDPVRPGPVVLSVCQDLQSEAYDFPASLFAKRKHTLRRPPPDAGELSLLVDALRGAKRPLFLLGGGVVYSGAKETISRFCQETGIPCSETQAGKGINQYACWWCPRVGPPYVIGQSLLLAANGRIGLLIPPTMI